MLEDVKLGDSISVNGICLTVTDFDRSTFLSTSCLRRSKRRVLTGASWDACQPRTGDAGERSFRRTFRVRSRRRCRSDCEKSPLANAVYFDIECETSLLRYIVPKGSISVDGTSLTVFDVSARGFTLSLIPHTYRETVLGQKQVGEVSIWNVTCWQNIWRPDAAAAEDDARIVGVTRVWKGGMVMFDAIETAIEALRAGRPIIVVDDEHRENEGDFVVLADKMTPETMNFLITEGKGLVCAALAEEVATGSRYSRWSKTVRTHTARRLRSVSITLTRRQESRLVSGLIRSVPSPTRRHVRVIFNGRGTCSRSSLEKEAFRSAAAIRKRPLIWHVSQAVSQSPSSVRLSARTVKWRVVPDLVEMAKNASAAVHHD